MKNLFFISIISISVFFIGCASKTLDLKPKEPSQTIIQEFESFNCNQIDKKILFLEKKAKRLARIQNDDARTDRVIIASGWILYGIPYFFLNGDSENAKEFENVLGKKEALENISIVKNCNFKQNSLRIEYEENY